MPSTTESPPSAGSGASGLRPSSGCSAAAEGCIPIQALREELSCGLELVANKAEAKEPSAHCVFGIFVLLGLGTCGSDRLCHLAECKAKLNVALELSGVKPVLLAVRRPWATAAFYCFVVAFFIAADLGLRRASQTDAHL